MKAWWRRIANYSLIVNTTLQAWVNRVDHNVMTWFLFPMAVLILFYLTFFSTVVWELDLMLLTVVGYLYYVPKGYRRYFYVVFFVPATLGLYYLIFFIAVVVIQWISAPPHQ